MRELECWGSFCDVDKLGPEGICRKKRWIWEARQRLIDVDRVGEHNRKLIQSELWYCELASLTVDQSHGRALDLSELARNVQYVNWSGGCRHWRGLILRNLLRGRVNQVF